MLLAPNKTRRKRNTARLDRPFFSQSGLALAAALPGTILVRRVGRQLRQARIVEVEAYLGPKDLASHSSKGRTARTEVMFGPPGHAYVYFVYGMHWMFNVVAGVEGEAHAVLIRGAEPLDGWTADLTGPAKLANHFQIARGDNGLDITGDDIHFLPAGSYRPRLIKTKRIGIDYAGRWKDRLLRFVDTANPVAARLRR
jgi:DNA-3-methyladenine glycosylase